MKLSLFKDKRFRYGTMSTAMMIFAVVIFVMVNVLANEFNESWDLTAEQLYTLTSQSHRFLDDLEMDVTLYYVQRTGNESHLISQLFMEYEAASPRITTEVRDPMINPTFVHRFTVGLDGGIPDGSVIVESAQGFRVITPMDMQVIERSQQTGQWMLTGISAEREITSAIHSLTLGDPTAIYFIYGSGEPAIPDAFKSFLEAENFIVREHNALLHDIPETADTIFLIMPTRDWSEIKADRILDYLQHREGRAFMALNMVMDRVTDGFPQLDRVLNSYGLHLGDNIIIEGDSRRIFGNNPTTMVPVLEPHVGITFPLIQQDFTALLMMEPTNIDVLELRRPGIVIEPLLTTSRDAYGRHLASDEDTILKVPSDEDGPFMMAAAVTENVFIDTQHTTRFVVITSIAMLSDAVNEFMGGGNYAFIVNALNWLQDQPSGIWIPVRVPPGGRAPAMLSDAQVMTMTGVAMGLLPVASFGIGIFIWFRRRHS